MSRARRGCVRRRAGAARSSQRSWLQLNLICRLAPWRLNLLGEVDDHPSSVLAYRSDQLPRDGERDLPLHEVQRRLAARQGRPRSQRKLEDIIQPETELTRVEVLTPAGERLSLPRRAYLQGTGGLGLFPGALLQELRVGAVIQNDFAKRVGRALQLGIRTDLTLSQPVGFARAEIKGSVLYFPPAGEVEALDRDVLDVRAQAALVLTVPVAGWLRLGAVADWLGFQGKVPSTERFGHSFQIGATLSIDRRWKPAYQPFW